MAENFTGPYPQVTTSDSTQSESQIGASVRSSELVGLARALDALNHENEKVNNARGLYNTSARLEAMGAVLQAWACVRHRVQSNNEVK